MPRAKKIHDEDIPHIVRLFQRGYSQKAVAKQYDISSSGLSSALCRRGIYVKNIQAVDDYIADHPALVTLPPPKPRRVLIEVIPHKNGVRYGRTNKTAFAQHQKTR
jgi:lambda repressor-like predicted transcriptional regulator